MREARSPAGEWVSRGQGLALAYDATRLLASLLFGVKASDPLTFGAVAGILAATALVAAYITALAVEPAIALRYE